MAERICPTCGQQWPQQKGRRSCAICRKAIRRHHRWFTGINNQPQHYNCELPTADPAKPEHQPADMFVKVSDPGAVGEAGLTPIGKLSAVSTAAPTLPAVEPIVAGGVVLGFNLIKR